MGKSWAQYFLNAILTLFVLVMQLIFHRNPTEYSCIPAKITYLRKKNILYCMVPFAEFHILCCFSRYILPGSCVPWIFITDNWIGWRMIQLVLLTTDSIWRNNAGCHGDRPTTTDSLSLSPTETSCLTTGLCRFLSISELPRWMDERVAV